MEEKTEDNYSFILERNPLSSSKNPLKICDYNQSPYCKVCPSEDLISESPLQVFV